MNAPWSSKKEEISLFELAQQKYKDHKYEESADLFQQVIILNPKNVEAYFHLGSLYYHMGQLSKALKAFQQTLRMDPHHTDAAIGLSLLYNDIGRYEEAKVVFDQADRRVKKNSTAGGQSDEHINRQFAFKHLELGQLYLTHQRLDEALSEFNKVMTLNPLELEARLCIAKVYSKKGFVNKAFDQLKKLCRDYPKFIPGKLALGILYYSQDLVLEARGEWQRILQIEPNHHDAKMYLKLSQSASVTQIKESKL